jgi:hypothetical protein
MNQARTNLLSRFRHVVALSVILAAMGATALAQDPSGRAARLNFLDGSVTFRPAGVDDWAPASVNSTVTTGDRVWTDSEAKAEFHVGSTAFRMAGQTDLSIVNLNDETTQLSIAQGSLNIRINRLDPANVFEVDTPNSAITLLRPGTYRINVDPDGGRCQVIVRRGAVQVTAEGSAFPVPANQLAVIEGAESVSYDLASPDAPDDWDNWCSGRDRHEAELAEQHYVSAEMTGYEDLAGYGSWHTDGAYGSYWAPTTVGAGWAPYSYGHWAWTGPYGWTWVDSSPWGFAPFHYGRWAYVGGGWGWMPGTYVVRPYYAPALVGFVGGGGFLVGGGAGIGWFPLGPHEVFVPGYAVSAGYYHNVNITHVNVTNINVTNVTRVNYVNRNVGGAVTAVNQRDFASGHVVAGAGVHLSGSAFASAQVTGMHAPIAPTKQAVLGGAVGGRGAMPPSSSLGRTFVAKSTPPPASPSFASQQKYLAASPGKPLAPETLSSLSKTSGGTTGTPKFKSATTASSGGLHAARAGLPALQPASATGKTTTTATTTKGTGVTTTSKGTGVSTPPKGGTGSAGKGAIAQPKGTSTGTGTGTGTGSTKGTEKLDRPATSGGTSPKTGSGSTGSSKSGSSSTGGSTKGSSSGGAAKSTAKPKPTPEKKT